ncbi:MAG: hypothetical protein EBT75_06655 [Proteobacteria bacterium]|nr:hypothetical protein [Pseudomonadota bacterium]
MTRTNLLGIQRFGTPISRSAFSASVASSSQECSTTSDSPFFSSSTAVTISSCTPSCQIPFPLSQLINLSSTTP